jgi:hypothetical protein
MHGSLKAKRDGSQETLHLRVETKHTMRIIEEAFTEQFFHKGNGTITSGMNSDLALKAMSSGEE